MNKIGIYFCFILLITMSFSSQAPSHAMQEDVKHSVEDDWTFEIVKETTMKKQEVVLNIKVKGVEGDAQTTFRNTLYVKDIDSSVFKNTKVAYTFFENPNAWIGSAELEDFQTEELDAINEQFHKRVRDLVKSKLDSNDPEANPWVLSARQLAEISEELIPLELTTEASALDILLPDQQKLILKEHFSALGWKSLDSIYGNVVLGLSDEQKMGIREILAEADADGKEIRQMLLKTKNEIQKELWAKIIEELREDQNGRLNTFRTSFLSRLRSRKNIREEKYTVDGVVIHVRSFKKVEGGVLVAEPCLISGHYSGNNSSVRDIDLFNHSLKSLSLDRLPIVDNQRYMLGIELSSDQKESLESIRDNFLDEMANLVKGQFEASSSSLTGKAAEFAIGAQAKKSFRAASLRCHEILDDTQKQILLENRLGFELFRHGAAVFESSKFCEQLDLDDDQQRKIRELIRVSIEQESNVIALTNRNLKDLDARVESQMSETVTQDQLKIIDEIR